MKKKDVSLPLWKKSLELIVRISAISIYTSIFAGVIYIAFVPYFNKITPFNGNNVDINIAQINKTSNQKIVLGINTKRNKSNSLTIKIIKSIDNIPQYMEELTKIINQVKKK